VTITAMVFDGSGQPLRKVAVPRPRLGPGEALVRVSLCTLCGSDLHTYFGRRSEPTPTVLGHEIVGVIEELAADAPETVDGEVLKVGDRIVWSVAVACGSCFFCMHDLPQKCRTLRKYGHEVFTSERGPAGGLTTHCHLFAKTAVVEVPDGLADELAGPAMCATATVAAAIRRAGDLDGKVVLVLGAGLLGLTTACMALTMNAVPILADVDPPRLAVSERFGIPHRVATSEAHDLAKSLTDGRGADVVFEMSGANAAVELALGSARVGGRVVLVGSVSPGQPVAVVPNDLVRRCLTVVGVHNYAPEDLAAAVQFLAASQSGLPFASLFGPTFELDRADEAFQFAERERPVRVAVRP